MRNVLITGVSGNLGRAMAERFLERGEKVYGLDLVEPLLDSENLANFVFERCDLRDSEAIEKSICRLIHGGGVPDTVINNAGIISNQTLLRLEGGVLEKHDFSEWRKVIDVTLSAAFYVTACCAQAMVGAGKGGLVINISSVCAAGNIGQSAYSAAKAGINAFTATAAKELSPLRIRVAAIAPGYIDTESTRSHVPSLQLDQIRKRTPTRKLGKMEELLLAIDFVIENSYFNGKVLELDGGLTL